MVAELAVVVAVVEAAVPSSPRWRWSSWSRAGVDLVVAELVLAVVADLTLGRG